MKVYIRILGIVSFVSLLGLLGLWVFGLFELMEDEPESLWILILLAIPLYSFIHFTILHRFGFNYNAEYSRPQKVSILVLAILFACIFLIMIPPNVKRFHKAITLEEELSKAIEWESDRTAYGYVGFLTTKHIDGDLLYQFQARSEKEFKPTLTAFIINFLDEDGFLIDEIEIKNFSKSVDNDGRVFGISSNSSEYFPAKKYNRIRDWDLLIRTKD